MSMQGRVKTRLQKLFDDQVLSRYPTIFKSNERLDMTPTVLTYVVGELQQYSLIDSAVDVKGVAYEEVVGSNLRGDRGEFFTPRNACRMAVRMLDPQANERILDPACGTGGFLITAMNHVLGTIEEQHAKRWKGKTPTGAHLHEYHRARAQYLQKSVYGLDLNPMLVRAAKMNMVMNNDGAGNLNQCNSLEHPHRWPDGVAALVPMGSIDVLFTNPPFGTNIVIDDPRILSQFDVAATWGKEEGGLQIRRNTDGTASLQSSQAPEVLFVERAIQLLKPGGRMGIVLPNGLLNNPGLAYFRQCILDKAQILAVVDMHRDLFQPHNDTQTSMVLLRKWSAGETAASHGDYPIFMAIADSVGHNKRGRTTYQRNPDGSLILVEKVVQQTKPGEKDAQQVTVKTPVVDDELDDVATAYHEWLAEMTAKRRGNKGGS